jgi:hypothetical protein
MQNSSWRTRAEAVFEHPKTHRAMNPDDAKPWHLAPSNEPLKTTAHKGKVHGGGGRRFSLGEARRIQMKCAPWSLKVYPLSQHPAQA